MSRTIVRQVNNRSVFIGTVASRGTPGADGTNGVNGGMGSSAGYGGLFTAAEGMAVGEGITRVKMSGYSAAGVGGADYIHDAAVNGAYVTANPRTAFLAADGRGFRLSREASASPQMVGAKGDGVTDDHAALQAWLDLGGALHLPQAQYYSSQRLIVRKHVTVRGAGFGFDARLVGGYPAMPGARIRFPANVGGLIAYGQTTIDSTATVNASGGTAFTQEGAAYSTLDGIGLLGGGGSSGTGFESRTRVFLSNVKCIGFGGKGFDLQGSADVADDSSDYGNVSMSTLHHCYATNNGSHGFHIRGRDASVVGLYSCDAIANGGWGFWDQSIFGGHMDNCHSSVNVGGSFRSSAIVSKMLFLNCYVEGGTGDFCDIPFPNEIKGGLLGGVTNINSSPALKPTVNIVTEGLLSITSTTGYTLGTDVPWSFAARAGCSYRCRFTGTFNHATTSVVRLGVLGSGGVAGVLRGQLALATNTGTESKAGLGSTSLGGTGDASASVTATPTADGPYWLPMSGDIVFQCTTAGTVSIQMATGDAANVLDVPGPCSVEWIELP